MFKGFLVFVGLVVFVADAKPQSCGLIPPKIYQCIQNPRVVDSSVATKCSQSINSCEKMTCFYRKLGWLDGSQVNKQKIREHFDKYITDHPEWSQAVQDLKTKCLGDQLKAQGPYVDCPAYDITHCSLISFIKNAQDSQWLKTQECEDARKFANACPVCPEDCFVPAVPTGSCNACYLTAPTTA